MKGKPISSLCGQFYVTLECEKEELYLGGDGGNQGVGKGGEGSNGGDRDLNEGVQG